MLLTAMWINVLTPPTRHVRCRRFNGLSKEPFRTSLIHRYYVSMLVSLMVLFKQCRMLVYKALIFWRKITHLLWVPSLRIGSRRYMLVCWSIPCTHFSELFIPIYSMPMSLRRAAKSILTMFSTILYARFVESAKKCLLFKDVVIRSVMSV